MNGWVDRPIRELCTAIVDCVNKTAPSQQEPTPYKMLRTTNVRQGWVDTTNVKYVDEPTYARWTRRMIPERGDIILTREAPFGDVGMLRSDDHVFLGQRLVMYRADESKCDPHFLMYSMMGPIVQAELKSLGSGSTVEHLRVPDCERITIPTPPLEEQRKIGAVLQSIDALVENNQRRVEVLEEMARAIYREWFVRFRYPGHRDVPLVDSALGPIPSGWAMFSFSDVLDYHIGGGWGTQHEAPRSGKPGYVIRGTDIPRVAKSDVSTVPFRFHSESNLRPRKLKHGDIVFEVSGGSKGQPVGRSLLIRQPLLDGFDAPAMCASFCKLVRADPAVVEPSILIRLLQDAYSRGQLDTYQVQSTGITNFKWKPFLEHFRVVLPPKRQQEEMVQVFDRLDDLIGNAGRRVGALVQIRNMLLPKLVTGQIDVSSLDLWALLERHVA